MTPDSMNRMNAFSRFHNHSGMWDVVVIGGGATGVGIALDAATRGLQVVLVEQSDFGKGTSSRSTKLVHGGVRYLRQGNFTLVRDALRERSWLRDNAPHLVHDLPFVIPCRSRRERWMYGLGLKLYDLLSVGRNFGRSRSLSVAETIQAVPALDRNKLKGGILYHDGQFDDARLLISLVRTAYDAGACLLNYVAVTDLIRGPDQRVRGVLVRDQESGEEFSIEGRAVINATGPFADAILELDNPEREPMIATSQGIHLVLPREFFPGNTAMIVPKTPDGRVIFIIPWHQHAIVGTTDTPIAQPTLEPSPRDDEIEFLLETAGDYLSHAPTHQDVLGYFTGIRPLVKGDKSSRTASLSRDHTIRVASSGLITIAGGKWTTYRKMAEDCVDRAIETHGLKAGSCQTRTLRVHGATDQAVDSGFRGVYGTDLESIRRMELEHPPLAKRLSGDLEITPSLILWAVREEMARTVDDVLAPHPIAGGQSSCGVEDRPRSRPDHGHGTRGKCPMAPDAD